MDVKVFFGGMCFPRTGKPCKLIFARIPLSTDIARTRNLVLRNISKSIVIILAKLEKHELRL